MNRLKEIIKNQGRTQKWISLKMNRSKKALGDIPSIRNAFIGFQEYLYEQRVG
jgi:hypothetical protein